MEQRQDSLLPPAIRHAFFPECFPSFGSSSVRFRACQGWAPLDYCAKTQTGHCSQVKLELEESVYTLKTVPLFSLAGAANKTFLLLLCSALRVLSLPLFKGLKMLLTLLFKQSLQSSREFCEREKRKDERGKISRLALSKLITSSDFACAGVKKKKGPANIITGPFPSSNTKPDGPFYSSKTPATHPTGMTNLKKTESNTWNN